MDTPSPKLRAELDKLNFSTRFVYNLVAFLRANGFDTSPHPVESKTTFLYILNFILSGSGIDPAKIGLVIEDIDHQKLWELLEEEGYGGKGPLIVVKYVKEIPSNPSTVELGVFNKILGLIPAITKPA